MLESQPSNSSATPSGWWAWYGRIPLYTKIVVALVIGLVVGLIIRDRAQSAGWEPEQLRQFFDKGFRPISTLILRFLSALATPLIFVAVVRALVKTRISGGAGIRMTWLLMINTLMAILVGLMVANVLQPGRGADLSVETAEQDIKKRQEDLAKRKGYNLVDDLLLKLPDSVLRPLADNDVLGVIVIALVGGIALRVARREKEDGFQTLEHLLDIGFRVVTIVLHWILALVPLAVFATVANVAGTKGLAGFKPMLWFVAAVLIALFIQAMYYLVRLRMGSWVRPGRFLSGGSDALWMAFSTASSAATMPVTYDCMKDKVGVSEESAGLGVLVGGTFNHDGTALYEAMAALFISQVIGQTLGFGEQLLLVVMSVIASVGAAGIPEAGLVTMIAVFRAVTLPVEFIPLLLTVDWFLDRCRTAINVMGDMCVTCLLDGKPPTEPPVATGG